MLTKNLLQFTRNGGRITPRFVQLNEHTCFIAGSLLNIYREAMQHRIPRFELEDQLEPYLRCSVQPKLAAALNKTILDKCEFTSGGSGTDAATVREMIFKRAADILKNPPGDPAQYRQKVYSTLAPEALVLQDIYGDLPEFDLLTQVPQWSAAELCNACNIAMIQGLLLYSDSLELTLIDTDAAAIRKFLRRLKFYRLLPEIKKLSRNEIKVVLSGPAAIFGESRKYGLQLASFFPVILLLKEWKLRAELKLRENHTPEILNLNSTRTELSSPIRRWAACVPEEVKLFIQHFREKVSTWHEAADADLPRIANCGAVIVDFSFEKIAEAGTVIHVELFHRYYTNNLEERLNFLQQHPDYPLAVGIDRSLLGKSNEQDIFRQYPAAADHIFFYSNYPGVERVSKTLEKVLESCKR